MSTDNIICHQEYILRIIKSYLSWLGLVVWILEASQYATAFLVDNQNLGTSIPKVWKNCYIVNIMDHQRYFPGILSNRFHWSRNVRLGFTRLFSRKTCFLKSLFLKVLDTVFGNFDMSNDLLWASKLFKVILRLTWNKS